MDGVDWGAIYAKATVVHRIVEWEMITVKAGGWVVHEEKTKKPRH